MKSQFSIYFRILTATAFISLLGSTGIAQHGGGSTGSGAGGGALGNAGTTMKLPSKRPTRPTPKPPRTGTRTPDNSAQLEDALSLADDARQNGRDEAAERGYLLATKLVPSDPRAYLGLGHIYYNQKKYP
ncbi:MAG TPA: hypothetical protein VNG71_01135, partial [Pyrinomonadaceae bacterium]|nr:hypothetical protein [Pyrinomonadaceae bacterium]